MKKTKHKRINSLVGSIKCILSIQYATNIKKKKIYKNMLDSALFDYFRYTYKKKKIIVASAIN